MQEQFWKLDAKLRLILADIDHWIICHGEEMTVTCLFRSSSEQRELYEAKKAQSPYSVHCDGRGADVRLLSDHNLNVLLGLYINEKYQYDEKRPLIKTLLTHDGTAMHHHVQVMPLQGGTIGRTIQ